MTPGQRLENINQVLAKGLLRLIAHADREDLLAQDYNIISLNSKPRKGNGVKH